MSRLRFIVEAAGVLRGSDVSYQCAIGRGGVIAADLKTEGDGASPAGIWALKRVFFRADRLSRPETVLPTIALRPSDGWCDAPEHPLYNRPVVLPFAASHEVLWREDHVYDVIVELGHNDAPVIPGRGSAIFFHLAHDDYRPTEGCVAIALADMLDVLSRLTDSGELEICAEPPR